MLGAIAGDVIGSRFEWKNVKSTDFELFTRGTNFTDDSVLTVAVADAILNKRSYRDAILEWGRKYPDSGYGGYFRQWLQEEDPQPYNSWGNGSAMRVSPVGWAFESFEKTLQEAGKSAEITHNHPEGIKGARAVAASIWLARKGKSKSGIKQYITDHFGYDLERSLEEIRPGYEFNESCQGTVPEAVIAFLESEDFEDAVRKAVSLGGDSDTLACITGSIAEAFYGSVPKTIAEKVTGYLTDEMITILEAFRKEFIFTKP